MVVRRPVLLLVLGLLAVLTTGTVAAVDRYHYGVSLLDPGSLPERVHACGRSFRVAAHADVDRGTADARYPGLGPLEQVGELHAPLHTPMEILGHPQAPECGMALFVGADDAHLTEFSLMGGP